MNLKSFTPKKLARHCRILLDRFSGLDFLTVLEPKDVGLDPEIAYRSSPSGNKYLYYLLSDFKISSQDSILDIGCGKGSAMRTMLKFPFKRVDGIELSETIADIATRNFIRLNANRSRIFIGDASLFNEYDAYNMVYFYNPFPFSVMIKVIDALIQSIHMSERELVIIYNNATCHDVIINQEVFAKVGVYPNKWGTGISTYSNYSYYKSRLSGNKSMRRVLEK